ncbi:type IV secretion system protein [Paraburkholderia sp. SIMBA_054]|uniref:type IV secretion system protein n=1 Tax=Paraburkholderia sp. SIMBA_054 TaxID=3085795 RepID=UPI00397C22CB
MSRNGNGSSGAIARYWRILAAVAVAAFGCLFATDAFADVAGAVGSLLGLGSGGCATSNAWKVEADTLVGVVGTMLAPFNDADTTIATTAFGLASQLMNGAYVVGGILASGYLLWSTLRYIADGQDNYISLAMDSMIPVAIGAAVLKNYATVVNGVQGIFQSMLVGSLSGGLTRQIAALFTGFLTGIAHGIVAEFNGIACANFFQSLAVYFNALLNVACLVVAVFLAIFALAELVGVLLTGSVLMGIGITVGPYFVVAGVTPWSRGFMDKWLSFLMGAFFYKTLITIILALMNGVISSVVNQVTTYDGTTGLPLGTVIALVGLMWVMRHIFLGVPGIVAALVGGHRMTPPSLNKAVGSAVKMAYDIKEDKARKEDRAQRQADRDARSQQGGQGPAGSPSGGPSPGGGGGSGGGGPTVSTQRGSFNPSTALGSGGTSGAPALAGSPSSSGAGSQSGGATGGSTSTSAGSMRFRPQGDVQDVSFKDVSDASGASGSGSGASMPRGGGAGGFVV